MKLLCDSTGVVLGRYPDEVASQLIISPDHALITVPLDRVPIPEAVIKVVGDDFVVDSVAIAEVWRGIKVRRDALLRDSDWTSSVSDYVLPNRRAWLTYRQALRDITKQPNPFTVVWPVLSSETDVDGSHVTLESLKRRLDVVIEWLRNTQGFVVPREFSE